MAKIGRPGLSREQKIDLWGAVEECQCARDIARALATLWDAMVSASVACNTAPRMFVTRTPIKSSQENGSPAQRRVLVHFATVDYEHAIQHFAGMREIGLRQNH